jgi:hypothetical protein
MTKQVQRRRGTATQHTSFTGAEGEISVNTTNKSIHVHDGVTAGGIEGARADMTNVSDGDLNSRLAGNTLSSLTITSADINGGTIDGTVIGGTTPAAGNFTTGSFTGNATFGDNDKAIFGAGSDLQIYHDGSNSYIDDQGTGRIIIKGNDDVRIRSGANEEMIVASSNGAVTLYHDSFPKLATTSTGVDITGTLTSDGLTVDGASTTKIVMSSDDNTASRGLSFTTSSNEELGFLTQEYSTGFMTISSGTGTYQSGIKLKRAGKDAINIDGITGDISFYEDTGTTPKFFWDASAESLGIGTTSPSAVLDLVIPSPAASASSGGFEITEGTKTFSLSTTGSSYNYAGVGANELWYYGNSNFGAMTFGSDGAVPIKFIAAGTEAMRIDSSGNVGIGTSSPSLELSVDGDIWQGNRSGVEIGRITNAAGWYDFGGSSNVNGAQMSHVGTLRFLTASTERMRIDSSGSLLVGTTSSPGSASGTVIEAGGTIGISRGITTYANVMEFRNPNGGVGSIATNGSSTSYNTSSDYRLKTDAQPMTGASARVQALNPVNFEWIADGTRVDGFLAHEAQEVVPEAVSGAKDAVDADGNPEYQGIDQSKLVPLLTAALQEALTEIADLKVRITALEG